MEIIERKSEHLLKDYIRTSQQLLLADLTLPDGLYSPYKAMECLLYPPPLRRHSHCTNTDAWWIEDNSAESLN